MTRIIGILYGRENTFPPAFLQEINQRRLPGLRAEKVRLAGTRAGDPCPYRLIVDRISHEIHYYRAYLKHAVLTAGTYVINNPFWWTADDKFFETALADRLGVAVPRTVLLPSKEYPEGVVDETLHNLEYPLPWEDYLDYVGLPAILKPYDGGGWKQVYKVHSLPELLEAYDRTGRNVMLLQECIDWDHYVRCLCIGERVLAIKYDPVERKYHVDHQHLSPSLGRLVDEGARRLNAALGYEMNSVEFAVRGDVPYAIDFMNPAPDFDWWSIHDFYFREAVGAMADLAVERALSEATNAILPPWPEVGGWEQHRPDRSVLAPCLPQREPVPPRVPAREEPAARPVRKAL